MAHHGATLSEGRARAGRAAAAGDADAPLAGWLDLTALVAQAKAGTTSGFQTLVGRVGDDVYCDFNGWNLYLRDTKFSQALCQVLADKAKDGELSRSELDDVLKGVPLKLGAGKVTVALYDVLPARCVDDLEALLALYAEDRL